MKRAAVRRTIIFGGFAALCVTALSSYGVCRRRDARSASLERLRVALEDIPFPERIASDQRHLRSKEALAAELLEDPNIVSALELSCATTRRAVLREYTREEFSTGRYRIAGRLVVSNSECLIAAYFGSELRHSV